MIRREIDFTNLRRICMSKELKMEVFASKEPVNSVRLHVYEFHTSELYENKYCLIRSAAWKIRNVNACGVFEDGSYIYTTEKISEEIPNMNFRLIYLGEQELGVLEHKKVYSELIKHWIIQKLRTVKIQKNSKEYYKYACRSNVTSRWIQTEQGFQTFYSGNRQISLERKYNFTVKILDDGKAYLKIDTSSVFSSNQTVYDYITQGMNPIGMEVKNEWGKNNQTGILTEICDYTVVDKIDFADSLKAYYTDMKKEGYRVENLPDQTPVVRVELQAGKIYPYYPLPSVNSDEGKEKRRQVYSRMYHVKPEKWFMGGDANTYGRYDYTYSPAEIRDDLQSISSVQDENDYFYLECMECIGIDNGDWKKTEVCTECIFNKKCIRGKV